MVNLTITFFDQDNVLQRIDKNNISINDATWFIKYWSKMFKEAKYDLVTHDYFSKVNEIYLD